MANMVTLGDTVKDQITGFSGVATARCLYLYGCERIMITSQKLTKEKNEPQSEWFDAAGVVKIGKCVKDEVKVPTGGPNRHEPIRRGM